MNDPFGYNEDRIETTESHVFWKGNDTYSWAIASRYGGKGNCTIWCNPSGSMLLWEMKGSSLDESLFKGWQHKGYYRICGFYKLGVGEWVLK